MKIQKTVAILACLVCCLLQASAQDNMAILRAPDYNKPKRFADLPDKQFLTPQALEGLFQLSSGDPVAIPIAKQFMLQGTIVSTSNPSDKMVKSVVVKCSNRPGITFTFTRITEKGGSFSYLGRLMGRDAGDALEIAKEGDGYVLRKKGVHEMINE